MKEDLLDSFFSIHISGEIRKFNFPFLKPQHSTHLSSNPYIRKNNINKINLKRMENLINKIELIREENWARLSINTYLATDLEGFYKCIGHHYENRPYALEFLKRSIINPPILCEEEIFIGGTDDDIFPTAFIIVDRLCEDDADIFIDYIPAYTFNEMSTIFNKL